jgi:hypothetical protein
VALARKDFETALKVLGSGAVAWSGFGTDMKISRDVILFLRTGARGLSESPVR